MNIGDEISNVRKKRGLTLRQLSEMTGVSITTIHRIEKGQVSPRADTVAKLGSSLGLKLSFPKEKVVYSHASIESPNVTLRQLKATLEATEWLSESDKAFLNSYLTERRRQSRKKKR